MSVRSFSQDRRMGGLRSLRSFTQERRVTRGQRYTGEQGKTPQSPQTPIPTFDCTVDRLRAYGTKIGRVERGLYRD